MQVSLAIRIFLLTLAIAGPSSSTKMSSQSSSLKKVQVSGTATSSGGVVDELLQKCSNIKQRREGVNFADMAKKDSLNKPTFESIAFRCPTTGKCIYKSSVCDGVADCEDGSDEKKCSKTGVPKQVVCGSGEFRCSSGTRCISSRDVCDGDSDCDDNSDEGNCPTRTVPFWINN